MLGIIDQNGYEHGNRVYSTMGTSPTLSARDYKDPIKIVDMVRGKQIMPESRAEQNRCVVIGRMDNTTDRTFESANRIYSINALAPTIPTNRGGDHLPKIIVKGMKNG